LLILSAAPFFSVLYPPPITGQISAKVDRGKEVSDILNSWEVPENKMTDKEETFALWEQ